MILTNYIRTTATFVFVSCSIVTNVDFMHLCRDGECSAERKKASGCDASLVIYHYRRKVVFFVHALRDIPFLVYVKRTMEKCIRSMVKLMLITLQNPMCKCKCQSISRVFRLNFIFITLFLYFLYSLHHHHPMKS